MGYNWKEIGEGWFVQLAGDPFDLEHCRRHFAEPFDPKVIQGPDDSFYLASSEFEGCSTHDEVKEVSEPLIARMNGAMAALYGGHAVKFANVSKIDSDGRKSAHVYLQAEPIVVRAMVGEAKVSALDEHGNPIPPADPKPSDAQRWLANSSCNPKLAALLEISAETDTWGKLYKIFERARVVAGSEKELWALMGPDAHRCKEAKQTANFHRHADGHSLPANPPSLQEARGLFAAMVRAVMINCADPP